MVYFYISKWESEDEVEDCAAPAMMDERRELTWLFSSLRHFDHIQNCPRLSKTVQNQNVWLISGPCIVIIITHRACIHYMIDRSKVPTRKHCVCPVQEWMEWYKADLTDESIIGKRQGAGIGEFREINHPCVLWECGCAGAEYFVPQACSNQRITYTRGRHKRQPGPCLPRTEEPGWTIMADLITGRFCALQVSTNYNSFKHLILWGWFVFTINSFKNSKSAIEFEDPKSMVTMLK
jgi:hypothetical protein